MPAAWVGPGCREKRVNFRRDRWLHGPDSESPTGKAGRHSRSTVAGLGEKRRLFFLYSNGVYSSYTQLPDQVHMQRAGLSAARVKKIEYDGFAIKVRQGEGFAVGAGQVERWGWLVNKLGIPFFFI